MANVSIVKIKIRRGTDAQRQQIVLDQGELGFTTDYQRLFVGDGATTGGISVAMQYYTSNQITLSTYPFNGAPFQIGDFIYDTTSSSFYILTGTPNTDWSQYAFIPILTVGNMSTIIPSTSAGLPPGSLFINTQGTTKTINIV
jgi:Major tropism determinant N-terminal domain